MQRHGSFAALLQPVDTCCKFPTASLQRGTNAVVLSAASSLGRFTLYHSHAGTSACPAGTFYCRNRGHQPLVLTSSFVDDGICGAPPIFLHVLRAAVAAFRLRSAICAGTRRPACACVHGCACSGLVPISCWRLSARTSLHGARKDRAIRLNVFCAQTAAMGRMRRGAHAGMTARSRVARLGRRCRLPPRRLAPATRSAVLH